MRVPVLTHRIPWDPPYGEELMYYLGTGKSLYHPSMGQAYQVSWLLPVLAGFGAERLQTPWLSR